MLSERCQAIITLLNGDSGNNIITIPLSTNHTSTQTSLYPLFYCSWNIGNHKPGIPSSPKRDKPVIYTGGCLMMVRLGWC